MSGPPLPAMGTGREANQAVAADSVRLRYLEDDVGMG